MALSLVVGPANAGKVALLLGRYLEALDRDPVLIVPTRSDVDRVERELLAERGALLSGSILTFTDLFERLAWAGGEARPVVSDVRRALLVRRAVARTSLNGLGRSARFAGFADALTTVLEELEGDLLEPELVPGHLSGLFAAYRAELDAARVWDRGRLRRRAVERLEGELGAWDGRPVLAYGFEDLTGAEWRLLHALAGRTDVHVSLPYEPGRAAFASLGRTAADLAALAAATTELAAAYAEVAPPALAHLERTLFHDGEAPPAPPLDGAVRFVEGAGARATLEVVAEEIVGLIGAGTGPERIGVVCPSADRYRAPLDTAFCALGVPYALEAPLRLGATPVGHALLALLRFAWLRGGRRDLFAFLRSPYSGVARASVDFVEGRLRGRAIEDGDRVEEETVRLRDGQPLPPLELLRGDAPLPERVSRLVRHMARAAHGLEAPPVGEAARHDLRAAEAALRVAAELEACLAAGETLGPDDVAAALERAEVRLAGATEPGRVAVLDLKRARTRRFDVVFLLGLEQGALPRRGGASPFLDDDARRELDAAHGARLARPDPVSRDRYLFYTACTRPTRRLYLVREAATDEGSPREPSPFWEEVATLFDPDEVRRATVRRPLSRLTWPVEAAPTERERLRGVAQLAAADPAAADALALANGWERRLDRARRAFRRPTALTHPLVLEELGARLTFNVTELERLGDCSSAWFVERFLSPRTIDAEVDAKLRGGVAHTTLNRFYGGLSRELGGAERVDGANLDAALVWLRACLDGALEGVRMELKELARRELAEGLWRDLSEFVRDEARSPSPLHPRYFEYGFQLELEPGLTLSGKVDRVDVDPFSARGFVQDYKSGKRGHSARDIAEEERLQIPLYMLVARDLIGIEPIGGVYRPLAGERRARGMVRAAEGVAGLVPASDELDEETFWAQVEEARGKAVAFAGRIRGGDIRHDPRGGECPDWCSLWTMCRKARA